MSQSNARFNASDTLIVTVHSVTMPVGFGGDGMKRKGRSLAKMAHLKRPVRVTKRSVCKIDEILDKRYRNLILEYFVHWKGYRK